MSEKPILFNTEMVRAILDGRKTVTRRVIKGGYRVIIPDDADFAYAPKGSICFRSFCNNEFGKKFYKIPYQVGDILYVRETWSEGSDGYVYKAFTEPFPQAGAYPTTKWHPSIHMPKEAARIWLRITDVRIDSLQNMTDDDARQEGIDLPFPRVEDFVKLWDSTIKKQDLDKYGWDANPWVWVIKFEKCERRLKYADTQAGRTPFAPVFV